MEESAEKSQRWEPLMDPTTLLQCGFVTSGSRVAEPALRYLTRHAPHTRSPFPSVNTPFSGPFTLPVTHRSVNIMFPSVSWAMCWRAGSRGLGWAQGIQGVQVKSSWGSLNPPCTIFPKLYSLHWLELRTPGAPPV